MIDVAFAASCEVISVLFRRGPNVVCSSSVGTSPSTVSVCDVASVFSGSCVTVTNNVTLLTVMDSELDSEEELVPSVEVTVAAIGSVVTFTTVSTEIPVVVEAVVNPCSASTSPISVDTETSSISRGVTDGVVLVLTEFSPADSFVLSVEDCSDPTPCAGMTI